MRKIGSIIGCLVVVVVMNSCSSSSSAPTTTDSLTEAKVFEIAKQSAGFTWYKKSDVLLAKGKKSGHAEVLLRTRFNATAVTMLDGAGKVKADAIFPEGSVVVKELYTNSTTLSGYAVMWKAKNDPNAASSGWVWAYLNTDGTAKGGATITTKGSQCIACHSISGHIDNTLMNVDQP